MFTGVYPAISMEKDCKNHKETLYSSKRKIVYAVGNPRNIYRLQGNPIVIIGFSLQSVNITGFPYNISTQPSPLRNIGFLCDSYSPFP